MDGGPVYTDVNDYLQYLTPWAQMSFVAAHLLHAQTADDPLNMKVYGDAVWNRWIDEHFGAGHDPRRVGGLVDSKPKSFAPGAYDAGR